MMITKRIFKEVNDLDLTEYKFLDLYYEISEATGIDDILGVFAIDKEGLLYQALQAWYKHKKINPIDYEDDKFVYITHGYGYSLYDDLVGGNGSSEAQNEFLEYINSID